VTRDSQVTATTARILESAQSRKIIPLTSGICRCVCDAGFSGDGYNCADIDECTADPTLCKHGSCLNYGGQFLYIVKTKKLNSNTILLFADCTRSYFQSKFILYVFAKMFINCKVSTKFMSTAQARKYTSLNHC
jgi:hypothetical protein